MLSVLNFYAPGVALSPTVVGGVVVPVILHKRVAVAIVDKHVPARIVVLGSGILDLTGVDVNIADDSHAPHVALDVVVLHVGLGNQGGRVASDVQATTALVGVGDVLVVEHGVALNHHIAGTGQRDAIRAVLDKVVADIQGTCGRVAQQACQGDATRASVLGGAMDLVILNADVVGTCCTHVDAWIQTSTGVGLVDGVALDGDAASHIGTTCRSRQRRIVEHAVLNQVALAQAGEVNHSIAALGVVVVEGAASGGQTAILGAVAIVNVHIVESAACQCSRRTFLIHADAFSRFLRALGCTEGRICGGQVAVDLNLCASCKEQCFAIVDHDVAIDGEIVLAEHDVVVIKADAINALGQRSGKRDDVCAIDYGNTTAIFHYGY